MQKEAVMDCFWILFQHFLEEGGEKWIAAIRIVSLQAWIQICEYDRGVTPLCCNVQQSFTGQVLNPKMTYVHICQHMYKTPLEIHLYVWGTRKFTAYVRHAA